MRLLGFIQTATSNVNTRSVTYSYLDSTAKRPIWFTNASSLFPRTTWEDSAVFGLPHATNIDAGVDTSFDVEVIQMEFHIIMNTKQELIK